MTIIERYKMKEVKIELVKLKPIETQEVFEMAQDMEHFIDGFANNLYVSKAQPFDDKMSVIIDEETRRLKFDEKTTAIVERLKNPSPVLKSDAEIAKNPYFAIDSVPESYFVGYVNEKPVGYGKVRHHLLTERGGHIGGILAKSYRNKTNIKILFSLLLEEAYKLGIDPVLITAYDRAKVSNKLIVALGGSNQETFDNGHYHRYTMPSR